MIIESYAFGSITVSGTTHNSDIIIYPQRVHSSWWRKSGHSLCMEDIEDILTFKPDLLIIGKGEPGLMNVPRRVQEGIRERGIELSVTTTEEAVRIYNQMYRDKRTVAALHLTC